MNIFAAVMTGKGTGAISTIQVFGEKAVDAIKRIFIPAGGKSAAFETGKIYLGTITDGTETIDQVTIGCESPHSFAINCHGNPLIVEAIMKLLQKNGAKLLTAEQLLAKILSSQKTINAIQVEARLAQLNAKTIQGTKLIANQIDQGLTETATQWLNNINKIPLGKITASAETILEKTHTAELIIYGCTIALIGPPNTGKSTLLNYLAGRQKAIVTDIEGTTRDWVTAQCQIESLSVQFIDTAGLDRQLIAGPQNSIEKEAQQRAVQILQQADMVLLVLDNSQTADQLDGRLVEKITDKKILTVLNKSDLPAKFDTAKLPQILANTVLISAKLGTAIAELTKKIRQILGIEDFDLKTTVTFTSRQENLVKQLKNTKSRSQALSIITELLNGQVQSWLCPPK